MMKLSPLHSAVIIAIGLLSIGVYLFFALASRDEIYYLCGNFKEGVSYTSVLRQLDTVTLSTYEVERSEQGKRVIHSSALHFNLLRCEIAFAQDERVSWASYR